MNIMDYWTLFLETGAPEAYLMYRKHQRTEGIHVSDDSGHRPQGNRL